jgi:hypothetical protein
MTTWAKRTLWLIILLVVGVVGLFLWKGAESLEEPNPTPEPELIVISSPQEGDTISSPVTVSGEARGNWYFEASFPVEILDADGRQLGIAPATAQGEWMTEELIPFLGSIEFATSTTPTGTIVFHKDNPSDMRQFDDKREIPIRFATVAPSTNMRAVKLYFYNANLDKDASGNVICSEQGLVSVERRIPLTQTPIQDTVRELLKGPTALERTGLPGTEFPLSGLRLSGASLSSQVLTLTFSDPENKTTGGSCRVSVLASQIKATAMQFGGVSEVRFAPQDGVFQP